MSHSSLVTPSLSELGWRPFFQQQLSLDEIGVLQIARVIEHHRDQAVVLSEQGQLSVPLNINLAAVCVGDWVLLDESQRLVRILERQSLFERKAAGSKHQTQLIAANLDYVFIVMSLNDDFNLNRVERYLTIANDAEVEPVIILTKADLTEHESELRQQVQKLNPLLSIHSINALDPEQVAELKGYCKQGKTIALMGSSGVGKSTLVNGLLGEQVMDTGAIREEDSKGRHTTTYRAIKWLAAGGLLMDTPGMRELQLTGTEEALKQTFADIEALTTHCRFSDCQHQQEPGCAIQAAIHNGELDERRLDNYLKLQKEQAFNNATLAEKRAKDKSFTKMVNITQQDARANKKGY